MPEYEVEVHPDDSDSDDSACSLDSEFGVPIMRIPGVRKTFTSTNEKLCRSSRAKTQITRHAYNEYMDHHYAFAMKVAAEQEPERPSLRHMLEGEKRTVQTAERKIEPCNKAAKSRMQQSREVPRNAAQVELPRKAAKKAASRIDADEAEGSETGRWTPHT